MFFRVLAFSTSMFALSGCAVPPVAPLPEAQIWQDGAFQYQPQRVTETSATLFDLDESVVRSFRAADRQSYTTERRLDQLLSQLYGQNGIRLSYASGHSTGAAQTWNDKRGDCLSLTILAYAAARSLGLAPHMQEVRVPVAIDRRDGVDFINGHVNVFIRNNSEISINGRALQSGGVVIDFDPQAGSRQMGQWLTEDEILARFYNNRATEYMVQRDDERAYAYYRSAITADPHFGPVFANLAQLYQRRGLLQGAEQLLLHAIALQGLSYAPLRSMQQLLQSQGRAADAKHYADLLKRRQDEDPYYWLGVGLGAMQSGRFESAINALERAASLTSGFEEIHRNLAIAYWRNGQREAANKQLKVLTALNSEDPAIALLSKKMRESVPESKAH